MNKLLISVKLNGGYSTYGTFNNSCNKCRFALADLHFTFESMLRAWVAWAFRESPVGGAQTGQVLDVVGMPRAHSDLQLQELSKRNITGLVPFPPRCFLLPAQI
jgi:hypothetical protein